MQALLAIKELCFAWPGGRSVLNGASLRLWRGDCVNLAGANGSGKTTLFRCITGLLKPDRGQIALAGRICRAEKDFQHLRRKVGLCLQNAEDQIIFPTVMEDICFGPLNLGMDEPQARKMAEHCLNDLGISHLALRSTAGLSGGETRLVALAGVLAMRPEILLLDEPLNGLDQNACQRLARVLASLPCAKIIVEHASSAISPLAGICQRVIYMRDGRLCEIQK